MAYKLYSGNGLIIALSVLYSCVSFGQSLTIEEIQPEPVAGPQCIDTEPFNDGHGWNGTCNCNLDDEQLHEGFGWAFATSPDTLVVGSRASPLGCSDSGSVSVFTINSDGSLQREAELVSSARTSGDNFGTHEQRSERIAVEHNFLAVATTFPSVVTVFQRLDSNEWVEQYTLSTQGSVASIKLVESMLFVVLTDGLRMYDITDGSLVQIFETPVTDLCPDSEDMFRNDFVQVSNNLVTIQGSNCNLRTRFSNKLVGIYEKSPSGIFVQSVVYEPSLTSNANTNIFNGLDVYTGDDFVLIRESVKNDATTQLIDEKYVTYKKNSDGIWQSSFAGPPVATQSFPPLYAIGDQITYPELNAGDPTPVSFSAFDQMAGWSNQVLSYRSPFEGTSSLATQRSYSGNRLSLINSDDSFFFSGGDFERELPDFPEPSLTIFEKDSSGYWTTLIEESFSGGGSVPIPVIASTGDNTFLGLSTGGFLSIIAGRSTDTSDTNDGVSDSGNTTANTIDDPDITQTTVPETPTNAESTETTGQTLIQTNPPGGSTSQGGGGSIWWPLLILLTRFRERVLYIHRRFSRGNNLLRHVE